MIIEAVLIVLVLLWVLYNCFGSPSVSENLSGGGSLWSLYGNGSFRSFVDKFDSIEAVTVALRKAGLESSNLIVGIDYTLSNLTQGEKTFEGKSLHSLNPHELNPYQQVITIIGKTLSAFDEDQVIPAFGFGDLNTKDQSVFPLNPQGYCIGVQGILEAYFNVTNHVRLSGPTSFAPLINKAVEIVRQTRCYHILIIIADGQVTNERSTIDAIVHASNYPLSIIMVGVGDGPWHTMKEFDDKLPQRRFDNFQFVEFHQIMTRNSSYKNPEAAFALQALMEIPDQFKAMKSLGLIG